MRAALSVDCLCGLRLEVIARPGEIVGCICGRRYRMDRERRGGRIFYILTPLDGGGVMLERTEDPDNRERELDAPAGALFNVPGMGFVPLESARAWGDGCAEIPIWLRLHHLEGPARYVLASFHPRPPIDTGQEEEAIARELIGRALLIWEQEARAPLHWADRDRLVDIMAGVITDNYAGDR